MDLQSFLSNASLQTRPKRRRHSFTDVHFLNTLKDIPERPGKESKKDRRHSTAGIQIGNDERVRVARKHHYDPSSHCFKNPFDVDGSPYNFRPDSRGFRTSIIERPVELPKDVKQSCVFKPVDNGRDEDRRNVERSTGVDEEKVIEAVSTYALSYTDDSVNVISAGNEVSPSTTGSSSPQETSKETSDEEIALPELLRKVESPMTSRRESVIDPAVLERIASMTPIHETSRSSSLASAMANLNGMETSPDSSDDNQGSDNEPCSSNSDRKQDMLGKTLVSLSHTRRGSLTNVLNSLSPQLNGNADPDRRDINKGPSYRVKGPFNKTSTEPKNITKHQGTTHLLTQLHSQMKDPWRPLSPLHLKSDREEDRNLHESGNNDSSERENKNVLGKIMNSPTLLKRRGSLGDVLRSLYPSVGSSPSSFSSSNGKAESVEQQKLQEQDKNYSPKKDSGIVPDALRCSSTPANKRRSMGDILRTVLLNDGDSPSVAVQSKTSQLFVGDTEIGGSPEGDKDGLLGRIIKSTGLTRRGSIGNVLDSLSTSTIQTAAEQDLSKTKKSVSVGVPKTNNVEKSVSTSKGLLAIVQRHVMKHSPNLQRKRRNSIASITPLTGLSEMSLKNTFETDEWSDGDKPVTVCESAVVETSVKDTDKDALVITNNNNKSTSDNNNNEIPPTDVVNNFVWSSDPSHCKDNKVLTPNANVHGKPNEKFQTRVDRELISPTRRRIAESESMDVSMLQSDSPSLTPLPRKISAPLPPRSIAFSQGKTSVTIIKRSPVTFVISNDKIRRSEVRRNGSKYQPSSGVPLMNSRFLPLGQEEAEEYSMMKDEEERKSRDSAVKSTITMSSRVTVYGENGSIVRKLGVAAKHQPLSYSRPTEERFAALSERYASLKAKMGGNDIKQKSENCSPAYVEPINGKTNTGTVSASSTCWTTVERISVQEFQNKLSGKSVAVLSPEAQKSSTVEGDCKKIPVSHICDIDANRLSVGGSAKDDVKNDAGRLKTVSSVYSHAETDPCTDENFITSNNSNSQDRIRIYNNNDVNNNSKCKPDEIEIKVDEIRTSGKTALDLRPKSPAQRTRTSVIAKLMSRKIGLRRKQSITPRVVQRSTKVYQMHCTEGSVIPATFAQFEKIRTHVENTVLRRPVRQQALTIQQLLNGLSSCLIEGELIAICKECSKTLRTLDALGSLPSYLSLESVIINPSGTIKFKHLSAGISIDDLYLAPEYSNRFASEKTCVFSLAATLWSAADWRLTEAEKPSLSPRFQDLLASMTDDVPDARPGLYDVLQTCESLQTEGDMTSRERCQALLWEYQASAAMEIEDATKRKALEEEKKHHDTLMGSISVAATFKGFLKQTAKPQERNPFVRAQKNQEQRNETDGNLPESVSANSSVTESKEHEAKKDRFVEDSQKLKDTCNKKEDIHSRVPSSVSTNGSSTSLSDANNNTPKDRKRGYSLTEDQKEQLLSLLASSKLNKASSQIEKNDEKNEEPINQRNKAVEDHLVKPPSPSLYSYPQYAQTEAHMMFSPITPGGRSVSPSFHSDISDSQAPAVPNFVPIAVPVPSVAPIPMPPFWYMTQGGMVPYPQPRMSPVQYVPGGPSMASSQSLVSTDSDVGETSDVDPRSNKTSLRSSIPRYHKTENTGTASEKDTGQRRRRPSTPQSHKSSKLPRPIWQIPVTKNRATPVESETNSNLISQRAGSTECNNEVQPARAMTPTPSLSRPSSPKVTPNTGSQTPPIYWGGVDMPFNNKQQKRVSTGSFPGSRPSSPSCVPSSPLGRQRSLSKSDSPVYKPKGSSSRPSSPAGSRSNSPVSVLVSKFEQMSQESSENSPSLRRSSVSSMISKFGSSSLVPEDRIVKGQFKPNQAASTAQPSSQTGPFRPSTVSDGNSNHTRTINATLSCENPITSHNSSTTSLSMPSDDEEMLLINNSVDPREVQRRGSDPGSNGNKRERLTGESPLCLSLITIHKASEASTDRCQDSGTRPLENIRKWSSQGTIMRDSSSDALSRSVHERLMSGLSLMDDYSAKSEILNKKDSAKARTKGDLSSESSCFTPSRVRSGNASSELKNEIGSSDALDAVSKSWQSKDSYSTEIDRKSSLDFKPVREKSSPKLRPEDVCIIPEKDNAMQHRGIKSAKDFICSPTSGTHKLEIPVDLTVLESTTSTISNPLNSVCGFELSYGDKDGSVLSPTVPLNPGSLKDFKPSNYFTNVTFKCGEMEPERDTNCLRKSTSHDGVGVTSSSVPGGRDPNVNNVRRFERKIFRSTGDVEDELLLSTSSSGGDQRVTSRDANAVQNVSKTLHYETGKTKDNTLPVTSIPAKNSPISTNRGSVATATTIDSKTSKNNSLIDPIMRSKHPSGDAPSKERSSTSSSNPTPPETLGKHSSSSLPQEDNRSRARSSRSKRNSLPTPQLTHFSSNYDRLNRPITKSSSQSNLSPNQKQVHKSSSQNNLSAHRASGDLLPNYSGKALTASQKTDNGPVGKSNPYPNISSSNNPYSKGDKSRADSSTNNAIRKGEPNKESNSHSSKPHTEAADTRSVTSGTAASSTVRYPYTRRGSTPSKGSPTIKPSPKSASNPTTPLYPKHFFSASSTYPGDIQRSMNPATSNIDQVDFAQNETRKNCKPKPGNRSNEEKRATSSGAGSNPVASPSESFSKSFSAFMLPSQAQCLDRSSSGDNFGDSSIFCVPPYGDTLPMGEATSMKVTIKRFPSSSSSDSGLNMSDPDERRKDNVSGDKSSGVWSPPTSPTSLSPTSPKLPIGSNIFYDPRDQQDSFGWPKVGSIEVPNEPRKVVNMSSSGQQNESSNTPKNLPTKLTDSPNKAVGNGSDNLKNLKGGVSETQNKNTLDSNEGINSLPEKRKDMATALKASAVADILKSASKERLASSTPPPDIQGRPSRKSPPSSSRVDSKELLGQLVKKVLTSAAAKQGSSPKASFAESASSASRENGKEKRAGEGNVFCLPEKTAEVGEKDITKEKGQSKTTDTSNTFQRLQSETNHQKGVDTMRDPESIKNCSQAVEQLSEPTEKNTLSKIIDLIHDEFAFDGYLDDGVEDFNMAEYVLSLAGMSEDNFKEAIADQYSDLYWDEDLLHEMYEAVTGGQKTRRPTLQFSESSVSDMSPPESISLSREESYLSLEPLYYNSVSRSSSERSVTGARDVLMSPLGEATEFLPIKVIAPEMQVDIQELLTPICEDYHKVMGIKLAPSVEDLSDKLGTKIMEISQQLMLERRAKKKSMNSYNKMADFDNKKDVKDLAFKLVSEIEESDKKIIYLKNVQRQLRNVYAERFGLDTSLLYAFLVSYNKACVTLEPELNNSFLNFSPIWNQRINESTDIVEESLIGPSLQSGTKLGLFSYLFDRHAMSQSYVRYFLYTYRYITTPQELFSFIREKCSASLRTDSSGQVYNHQLQIRYRALDLVSEWIDGFYQFDFKTNPSLIRDLLAFVKDELILVDRSERGHYLMELIAEKQKQDLNNNSSSEEVTDSVAVLQLDDPQGLVPMEGKKDSLKKPLSSRKAKSPVQCFRRTSPDKGTTYKPTLYLKALSVLDHSSRVLAEQLTLIQQDLFFQIHPVHFLNSRAHGIGVGRSQSPTRERDSIFGFSTGSRRVSEVPVGDQGALPWENNLYVSESSTDGALEDLLEHAQDVSLWIAVEICSASSLKGQLALITKFVNAARYCCEIRNYSTCMQILDALEMFVVRHLPVWKQVPTKTAEVLEELKAVKVLLKTDSSWLMKSESSREKPTIPCFLLFVIHVQQQELGGFTLPSDLYKWTKMRSVARLVDQLRLFKQMRYAFQTDEEIKDRLKQRIQECKKENLHALASENASNFHLSSSHGSRKFHDAFKKMKATFGGS